MAARHKRLTGETTMAIDTEVQDVTENQIAESAEVQAEKAKRERVDLETLDPNDKTTLMLTIPAGMKLALTKNGETETLVASAYARKILADAIGYTIPDEFTEGGRVHKYATDDERKAATKAKADEKRELMKKLLSMVKAGKIDMSAQ